MKKELSYYEVFPKLLPSNRESRVKIRPLGRHAAFDANSEYIITVRPFLEAKNGGDGIRDYIIAQTAPDTDGGFTITHKFGSEQEHFIRVYKAPLSEGRNDRLLQVSVYSLDADLYGLKPLRGDFHVHTNRSDGKEEPAVVCANYRKDGFDFLAITDHRRYSPSLEAIEAYKDIPTGLGIFPGEEVHPPENHIHIVNFGGSASVNELFEKDLDGFVAETKTLEKTLPDLGEGVDRYEYASCALCYEKIRRSGGLAIYAHPHWQNDVFHVADAMTVRQFHDGLFDAFELLGGQTQKENNMQTAIYQEARAQGLKIPVVGSSDSHGTINANWYNWTSTIVMSKAKSVRDIKDAVMSMRSAAVETYPGEAPRVYGSYRMVKLALFLLEDYFPVHDELCAEEGRLMKKAVLGCAASAKALIEVSRRADEYLDRCYMG